MNYIAFETSEKTCSPPCCCRKDSYHEEGICSVIYDIPVTSLAKRYNKDATLRMDGHLVLVIYSLAASCCTPCSLWARLQPVRVAHQRGNAGT